MVYLSNQLLQHTFRECYKIPNKLFLQWFPGHMGKGMKQMQQKLKSVDCIIEVHDSRIPLSGRNPHFKHSFCGFKPHILVLNKKDLTNDQYLPKVKLKLKEQGITNVILTNCKDHMCNGVKRIVPLAIDMIKKSDRFNRDEEPKYYIMVIGVPNVGKSSVINILRNKFLKKPNAAAVGGIPGITRSVTTEIKVCETPPIYIFDTPGILTPNVPDTETGMKLALCSSLQDHLVGIENIADYLLFWLNKNQNYRYVDLLGLKEPCDNITEVLVLSAVNKSRVKKINKMDGTYSIIPDTGAAAAEFVKLFRTGKLGKILLDQDSL